MSGFQTLLGVNRMKFKKKGAYRDAIATDRGLEQANGVLLVKVKMTKAEQNKWNGTKPKKDEKHSYSNRSSKEDLEEFGRTIGIELDKRKTKKSLLKQLKEFISSKK